jgi:hypothetical protein
VFFFEKLENEIYYDQHKPEPPFDQNLRTHSANVIRPVIAMPAKVTPVLGFGPRRTLMQRPTVGVVGIRYTFFSAEVNGIVRPAGVASQFRAFIFVKFAVVYLISDIALFV